MEGTVKPFSRNDFWRTIACVFDYMYFMDERTCVNGTVCLVDISHYSLKLHAAIPLEDRKVFGETWQVNFNKFINFNHRTVEHLRTFDCHLVKLPECELIVRSLEI